MIQKAGCILLNIENKKIALVHRKDGFSFPKGHLEKNETLIECALRETTEETGHDCHLVKNNEIATIHYNDSKNEKVENHFYLAIDDGVTKNKIAEKDKEETIWIDFSDVEDMLTHENLKEFWNKNKLKIREFFQTYND